MSREEVLPRHLSIFLALCLMAMGVVLARSGVLDGLMPGEESAGDSRALSEASARERGGWQVPERVLAEAESIANNGLWGGSTEPAGKADDEAAGDPAMSADRLEIAPADQIVAALEPSTKPPLTVTAPAASGGEEEAVTEPVLAADPVRLAGHPAALRPPEGGGALPTGLAAAADDPLVWWIALYEEQMAGRDALALAYAVPQALAAGLPHATPRLVAQDRRGVPLEAPLPAKVTLVKVWTEEEASVETAGLSLDNLVEPEPTPAPDEMREAETERLHDDAGQSHALAALLGPSDPPVAATVPDGIDDETVIAALGDEATRLFVQPRVEEEAFVPPADRGSDTEAREPAPEPEVEQAIAARPAPEADTTGPSRQAAPAAGDDTLVLEMLRYDGAGGAIAEGRAPAGSTVAIRVNGKRLAKVTVAETGAWAASLSEKVLRSAETLRFDATSSGGRRLGRIAALYDHAPSAGGYTLRQRRIVVRENQWLWGLAREIYGDGRHAQLLIDANADRISDPSKIYPGQVLYVPELVPQAARPN